MHRLAINVLDRRHQHTRIRVLRTCTLQRPQIYLKAVSIGHGRAHLSPSPLLCFFSFAWLAFFQTTSHTQFPSSASSFIMRTTLFIFAAVASVLPAVAAGVVPARPAPTTIPGAAAPVPSGSLSRRAQAEQLPLASTPSGPSDLSRQMCPDSLRACPISAPTSSSPLPSTLEDWLARGYECADFESDLTSCGGCGILAPK
jgi:hypothetical protein